MLAIRIREGSKGRWGGAEMPAHPDISLAVAATLARSILDTPPADAPTSPTKTDGAEATWSFRGDSLAPPESLHPSLRSHEIKSPDFTPLVGGLAWLPDGRLGVSTWDPDGAVFAIDGWADTSDLQQPRLLHQSRFIEQHNRRTKRKSAEATVPRSV